jgi:hypothetical protein
VGRRPRDSLKRGRLSQTAETHMPFCCRSSGQMAGTSADHVQYVTQVQQEIIYFSSNTAILLSKSVSFFNVDTLLFCYCSVFTKVSVHLNFPPNYHATFVPGGWFGLGSAIVLHQRGQLYRAERQHGPPHRGRGHWQVRGNREIVLAGEREFIGEIGERVLACHMTLTD